MGLLSLEASRAAYRADFAVYGAASAALAALLLWRAPPGQTPWLLASVGAGGALWTLVEYGLHRFVLHGLQPFQGWHTDHHRRPAARIGTPTLVSAAGFAALVFAPAWALLGAWPGCALTLGMLLGYLAFAAIHHAAHHAVPGPLEGTRWLHRRRRWHAAHHRRDALPGCYGVSTGLWDRAFGSTGPAAAAAAG